MASQLSRNFSYTKCSYSPRLGTPKLETEHGVKNIIGREGRLSRYGDGGVDGMFIRDLPVYLMSPVSS